MPPRQDASGGMRNINWGGKEAAASGEFRKAQPKSIEKRTMCLAYARGPKGSLEWCPPGKRYAGENIVRLCTNLVNASPKNLRQDRKRLMSDQRGTLAPMDTGPGTGNGGKHRK